MKSWGALAYPAPTLKPALSCFQSTLFAINLENSTDNTYTIFSCVGNACVLRLWKPQGSGGSRHLKREVLP